MENITIGQIAIALGVIAGIAGSIKGIVALVQLFFNWLEEYRKKKNEQESLRRDIDKLKNRHDKDMEESRETDKVLIKGILACLKGLQEQGCNGPVTKGIKDIETYLINKG